MSQPVLPLNDGRAMPQLGFGVWQVENGRAVSIVGQAIDAGYLSIDTAAIYGNEEGVGAAIRQTGIPRDDLFITTKLWNDDQGFDTARKAFDASLKRLGLDYVDLYLIHWPAWKRDAYADTWRAFIKMKEEGRAKSIGVSNFNIPHLQRLFNETGVVPSVNQIELHPRFQQRELRAFHAEHGIVTEAWSPLGQGTLIKDERLGAIARKHGKSTAQVILRWHLDNGVVAIPKSATPVRIRENFDVFGFALDDEDRRAIDGLDDRNGRVGPDPELFT